MAPVSAPSKALAKSPCRTPTKKLRSPSERTSSATSSRNSMPTPSTPTALGKRTRTTTTSTTNSSPAPAATQTPKARKQSEPRKPLWEQVKVLEEKKEALQSQVLSYSTQATKLKLDKANLEKSLTSHETEMSILKGHHSLLSAQLTEAKCELKCERDRIEQLTKSVHGQETMHQLVTDQAEEHAFQSRKFRTALAAAFKLVDGLEAQTSFRGLIESTDILLQGKREAVRAEFKMQLAKSLEKGLQVAIAAENAHASSSDDIKPLMALKRRRRQAMTRRLALEVEFKGAHKTHKAKGTAPPAWLDTDVKKEHSADDDGDDDDDDDEVPIAKTRRLEASVEEMKAKPTAEAVPVETAG